MKYNLVIFFAAFFCLNSFNLKSQIKYSLDFNISYIGKPQKESYSTGWHYYYYRYENCYSGNSGINIKYQINNLYLKSGLNADIQRFYQIKDHDFVGHHSPGSSSGSSKSNTTDIHVNIPLLIGYQINKINIELGIFSYHRLYGWLHNYGWREYIDGYTMPEPEYSTFDTYTYYKPFTLNNIGWLIGLDFTVYKNLNIQIRFKRHLNFQFENNSFGDKPYNQLDFGFVYNFKI